MIGIKRGVGLCVLVFILLRILTDYIGFEHDYSQVQQLNDIQVEGVISEHIIDDYNRSIYKLRLISVNGRRLFTKRYVLRMVNNHRETSDNLEPGVSVQVSGSIKKKDILYNDGMTKPSKEQYPYHQLATITIQSIQPMDVSKYAHPFVSGYASYTRFVHAYHKKVIDKWHSVLPSFDVNLLDALFLGDRSQMDPAFSNGLKNGGVIHVFAVSGMHIGMLYLILGYLGRCLPVKPKLRMGVMAFFLYGYILFIGCPISAFRAALMCGGILYGTYSMRPGCIQRSLGMAAGVSLMLYPESIFSVSFWLSFVSVIAIISLYPLLSELITPQSESQRLGRQGLVWSVRTVLLSCCVLLLTTPILMLYFGEVSLNGILLNLFVLPMIPLLFWMGLTVTCLLFTIAPLGGVLAPVIHLLSYYFQWISVVGDWMPFTLWMMPWSRLGIMLYYLLLLTGYLILKEITKSHRYLNKEVNYAIRL